jgi:penicillin-insensitive murein DD-endopeptidase
MNGQEESISDKKFPCFFNIDFHKSVMLSMKMKKRWIFLSGTIVLFGLLSLPEIYHTNQGVSESTGSVRNGKLKNGWLMPFEGENFRYFSHFSYYILNNAYVNSSVYQTLMDAYKTCETTCPDREFVLMECTRKRGGRMLIHWTHQNGTSVDFMVPKKRGEDYTVMSNHAGMFHYLFQFNENGKFSLNPKTEIDFETMAHHLLALDDAAKKNGLYIRKILFNTSLQDELYNTAAGRELQKRDIRIIPHLSDLVNRYHDDHYHVDFENARQ